MYNLKPLSQWICDHCGEVIEKPEDGWLEWLEDEFPEIGDGYYSHSFRIVHNGNSSPLRAPGKFPTPSTRCYQYADKPNCADMHLDHFTGTKGMAVLLAFLDRGHHVDPGITAKHRVKNIREWVELFRRLHTPYHEEARLYWNIAAKDGFFDGANEYVPYIPEELKMLIQNYSEYY